MIAELSGLEGPTDSRRLLSSRFSSWISRDGIHHAKLIGVVMVIIAHSFAPKDIVSE